MTTADFDVDWYLATYPDVAANGMDPLEHYLTSGRDEGRLPLPPPNDSPSMRQVAGFDSAWYLATYPDVAAAGIEPLEHYLASGRDEGRLPGPTWDDPADQERGPTTGRPHAECAWPELAKEIPGHRARTNGPRILLVGHAAGLELFGAERSLLELLDGFATLGHDVVVTVPSQVNEMYLDDLRARCRTLHIMPVPPRRPNEAPNDELVDHWCRLIDQHSIQAVHVNTILPREPLLAARRKGIAAVVHAREVPFGDAAMCAAMDATASEIVANVTDEATYVIANSSVTAFAFDLPGRTAVVPNIVNIGEFGRAVPSAGSPRVALIGDATPKKGILDFARLATTLRDRVDARFVVIGPSSRAEASLRDMDLPDNLTLAGYSRTPSEALAAADIVVNVSRCREAFARTVLEGMAAGLPIVAYNRGAIPLLVDHGRTGFLIPFDDSEALANAVERLCCDPELRHEMGAAGREVAATRFAPKNLARALASAYHAILPTDEAIRQRAGDVIVKLPSENRTSFLHPFFAGYRSRWSLSTGVAFLDSTTLVASSLLGRRLYTIRFDASRGDAEIIAEIPTRDEESEISCDLIETDGRGRVLTSDYEHSSVSLYEYNGDQLRWTASLDLIDPEPGVCHSARFLPGRDDVVAACMTTGTRGVRFISTTSGDVQWSFEFDGRAPKDIAFKSRDRMAVALHGTLIDVDPLEALEGCIALLAVDLDTGTYQTLAEYDLPDAALEGLCLRNDRLYAASQSDDVVMVFDTSFDQLRRLPDMEGFSFPHQCEVSPDGKWLAVACFGDTTVVLRPLTE